MKYIVTGSVVTHCELEVEADSATEAQRVAADTHSSYWTQVPSGNVFIDGVYLGRRPKPYAESVEVVDEDQC